MKADSRFTNQSKEFWAHVRTISQEIGYTDRKTKSIRIPSLDDIRKAFADLELNTEHICDTKGTLTNFGQKLIDYFHFRAEVLNGTVEKNLMDGKEAKEEFKKLRKALKPTCPLPMNKQKGAKKNHAFLTGMVNMIVESNIGDLTCNYNPLSLTTMTHDRLPLRTMARRVDGAFPSVVNPIAIWEIKEYYYTTTFGSRVADGVYETLLDGMELEELKGVAHRKVHHLLVVDAHFTWWTKGRSYLCRMIDILHMGYVDEIIFGREVLKRLSEVVQEWKATLDEIVKQKKE